MKKEEKEREENWEEVKQSLLSFDKWQDETPQKRGKEKKKSNEKIEIKKKNNESLKDTKREKKNKKERKEKKRKKRRKKGNKEKR